MTLLTAFTGSAQALPITYLKPLVDPQPIAEQKVPAVFPTLVLVSDHLIGSSMGPLSPVAAGDDL
jgi:hypothetical protein